MRQRMSLEPSGRALNDGWCPVHAFAANGDLEAIKQIDDENIRTLTKKHETALDLAISFGHVDCVAYFLTNYPTLMQFETHDYDNVLHTAVRSNRISILKLLLPKLCVIGYNNRTNKQGLTPIQMAVVMGFLEVFDLMIQHAPELLSFVDVDHHQTLLHLAIQSGQMPILAYLLNIVPKHWLLRQDYRGDTPLNLAIDENSIDIDMIKVLQNANPAAIVIPNSQGMTPFLKAAKLRFLSVMQYLMEQNPCVVGTKTHNGWTALHFIHDVETAKKILTIKPDLIHALDDWNQNPIHCIEICDENYVRFLLDTEPRLLYTKNMNGLTPFQVAAKKTAEDHMMSDVLDAILRYKPELIDTDERGNTVLHTAVAYCHTESIAMVFANRMSNLYEINADGETPFHIAYRKKHMFALQLFKQHVTVEMIVETHAKAVEFDVQTLFMQQCESLSNSLLPDLLSIVFAYLGLTNKKRKHT